MIQHCAVRFVINKPWHKLSHDHDSVTEMLTNLGWTKLEELKKIAMQAYSTLKITRGLLEVPARCIPQLTPYAGTIATANLLIWKEVLIKQNKATNRKSA